MMTALYWLILVPLFGVVAMMLAILIFLIVSAAMDALYRLVRRMFRA